MLYGQKTRLPLFFQILPGSITDVTTLHNFRKYMKAYNIKKANYVMDRGFYSKQNIDEMLKTHDKFTLSVPIHNKWLQSAIDKVRANINMPQNYYRHNKEGIYFNSGYLPLGRK